MKTKSLHRISIGGIVIITRLHYNLNTNHIGIGNTFTCQKPNKKQYYIDNKDKIDQRNKQYNIDNKDEIKHYHEQYRKDNKDKIKQYQIDNKDKIKQYMKQYNIDNKDEIKQKSKIFRELNRDPNTPRMGSIEYRIKLSCGQQGININDFDGFLTELKYCKLWTESFRETIRERFHNKCYLCGKTQNRKLSVHHVNYDKNCLCQKTCEFVPLCGSCHAKTNHNRQYWEDLIMNYLFPNRYFMIEI